MNEHQHTTTRISLHQLEALSDTLTDTEKEVLTFLDDFHYAYGSHIQRLFFTHGTPDAMTRARNRLLTNLAKATLLYRYPRRPLPGNRHGSTEHIYALAHAGQRIMNELRFAERPYRSIERTTSHFEHALYVTDLSVQLQEYERASRLKVIAAQGEPACHRHFGLDTILKPDAYTLFHITKDNKRFEVAWFIEIERSRQSESTTRNKLTTYRNYMEHLPPDKLMPRVLFIAFTEKHRTYLARLLDRNAGNDKDVFTTTLFADALPTMLAGGNL